MLSPVVMMSRTGSDSTDLSQRVGDLLLTAGRRVFLDAHAEVADHGKAQRSGRRQRIGIGDEAIVVAVARLHERSVFRRPVPPLACAPLVVFDEHLVGVFGVGRQTRHPAVIRDLGLRHGDHRTASVVHLDPRGAVRRRLRADGVLARRVHELQIVVVDDLPLPFRVRAKVEGAPRNQCGLVTN